MLSINEWRIVMEREEEIPCAVCHSWNAKEKKFSCEPRECKELSAWLLKHAAHLSRETPQMQAHYSETTIQYVV
jgi:hypothetical protein